MNETYVQFLLYKLESNCYLNSMDWLVKTLVGLIALQHIGFLYLEMFLWTSPTGQKVFGTTAEFAKQSASLAANQGLYNGFLVAGLVWSLLHPRPEFSHQLMMFFVGCVLVAGLYGGWTVSSRIVYIQALPALLTLILLLVSR